MSRAQKIKPTLIVLTAIALTTLANAVELDQKFVASGLDAPVFVGAPPGVTDKLFVVEQPGRIMIIDLDDDTVFSTPFLDITDRVDNEENEEGLLGLAFHPNYDVNGYFYLNYIHNPGSGPDFTRISRFKANGTSNYNEASTASSFETILLTYEQPQWNHNGGMIAFQPRDDGAAYLYIGSGDGGNYNDLGSGHNASIGNGQDLNTLLGKMLRIDVDEDGPNAGTGGTYYDIPSDNPYLDEIWSFGLRNPYRFGFDRETGDLYIGDVGQGEWEEINHQSADSVGGENWGWRFKEGPDCFNPSFDCDDGSLVDPIYSYDHATQGGIAVIGGYPYRGLDIPFIEGHYIFADVSGVAKTFLSDGTSVSLIQDWESVLLTNNISSFGEDGDGELYFAIRGNKGLSNGAIYKIIPTDNQTIRVDFAATGLMKGNETYPFDKLDTAVRSVAETNALIEIVGDSSATESNEMLTIDAPMIIQALNGTVRIGQAAPALQHKSTIGFETRE